MPNMTKPPNDGGGRNERYVNLSNTINPWFLEDQDGVVFEHLSGVEIGLQYWLPEMSSVTSSDVDVLYDVYANILESCQIEKGRLRFMTFHRPATEDEIVEMHFPATDDAMQAALIRQEREANEARVQNAQYKVHDTYVFIHIPDQRSGVSRSDARSYSDEEYEHIILMANEERDRIISALNSAGIPASPLIAEDPFHLMWRYYNLGSVRELPPAYDWDYELPDVTRDELRTDETIRPRTLRAQVCNSDLLADRIDYIRNGDALIVVSDMANYGEQGYPGMADRVMARFTNHTYMYVVDVSFTNERAIKNRVERNITAAEKNAADSGRREEIARASKMAGEAMQAYSEGGRFVRFGMSMVVVCHTEDEVRKVRQFIRNDWNNEGKHLMTLGRYSNWDQFAYRLAPYSGRTTDFLHDQQVNAIPVFLPFYGPWYNTGGVTLGVFENAYGGQQRITLPKSSEAAPHMAVIGSSRSGKSFTIQKILMNLYMTGAQLRIMDIKNDYAPLVAWLGGQFIPCDPGATFPGTNVPVRYNIFEGRPGLVNIEERTEIIAFLKALIADKLDREEQSLLEGAVNEYVNSKTSGGNFEGGTLAGFVNFLFQMNRLGDMGFSEAPDLRIKAKQLAVSLQNFTQGIYGAMFNGPSTINVQSRVVVFDMSRLGNDQKMIGAVTTMINKMVWDAAKKRTDLTERIVLLSEESGVTGQIPEVKKMLETVILSGAAYNLMEIIVAQNYKHIEALDGILNNISRIIMGRSAPQEAALIARMLEMNSEQENTLKTLQRVDKQYNELMVREAKPDGSYQMGVIRYRPTALEYALFSSDPKDKTMREQIMRESGNDMMYAVQRLSKMYLSEGY